MKKIIFLLVLAGLGAGGFWYWKHREPEAPQYQFTEVARGDITQVVTATGQIEPVMTVNVGSQISGTIQQLFADYNTPVKEGQLLAQIEPSTYQANVRQAEGALANAKASLELAQVNARRAEELRKQALIPQSDLDKSVGDLHQAEAAVIIAEAALSKARTDLARCSIYAPIDGVVLSRSVDLGQTVAASFNTPQLFLIANDLKKMQIEANVSEADIGSIALGQSVDFTVDAFPERSFRGKVVEVYNWPTNVQNVVSYDTIIEVTNPDLKLRPGMTANVSIIVAQRTNVLKVANAALRFRPGIAVTTTPAPKLKGKRSRTAYRLLEGKPVPVEIKAGITDSISTEVIEGLAEGEKLITGMSSNGDKPKPSSSPFGGGLPRRF
jgi:HlyD family secretion protein